MIIYKFSIQIFADGKPLEVMAGKVTASRSSEACMAAWPIISARTAELKAQGLQIGVGDLYVQAIRVAERGNR